MQELIGKKNGKIENSAKFLQHRGGRGGEAGWGLWMNLPAPARTQSEYHRPPPAAAVPNRAHQRVIRSRASRYGQFCACRHLEEGGGQCCAHALGTAPPLPHTGFMCTPDKALGRLKPSARCSYALLLEQLQNCVPHSLSSARFSLPQFVRLPHAPAPRSAVLHHPLLWLPAALRCLSCPFFSGPCSLQ